MEVTLKVRRFNPEKDLLPHFVEYKLEALPTDRVLDLLNHVKWEIDGTLAYRRSCGHGICGSDAMRINGVNRLACKVLVKDLANSTTLEPLCAFNAHKDLIVYMEPCFAAYKAVIPFLSNVEAPPPAERLHSPEARALFANTTKCILCAPCTSSCPASWTNGRYIG